MKLTKDLIKKKAEHNDGITADLEEISLHQLEIEKIEVIGHLCKKLKILYLQNNIISKIENLEPLKDLEYLNLALNNVEKIEGLKTCEFLNKLDLTVNFIDLDALEESVNNLKCNTHLNELYLIGNPCCEWEGCKNYIIANLPQLQKLDGNDITRSDRIKATAELEKNTNELRELAVKKSIEKKNRKPAEYDPDHCENTPETRLHMYRELAEQKQQEEDKKNANLPKQRNYELEHLKALERERGLERQGVIRQCNQGHWNFRFSEDDKNNTLILEVDFPQFLSTSLIDADIQPFYISVVAKGKTLRLELPEEVQSDKSKVERSTTTGTLKLIMPKVNKGSTLHTFETIDELNIEKKKKSNNNVNDNGRVKLFNKNASKGEQILEAVKLTGIVKNENKEDEGEALLKERKTVKISTSANSENIVINDDDDEIPPLI